MSTIAEREVTKKRLIENNYNALFRNSSESIHICIRHLQFSFVASIRSHIFINPTTRLYRFNRFAIQYWIHPDVFDVTFGRLQHLRELSSDFRFFFVAFIWIIKYFSIMNKFRSDWSTGVWLKDPACEKDVLIEVEGNEKAWRKSAINRSAGANGENSRSSSSIRCSCCCSIRGWSLFDLTLSASKRPSSAGSSNRRSAVEWCR